jgi:pimeloyl-ACP methyl ester carboxylesterase
MAKHIYFIPGMGTTKEVFKNIDLQVENVHYIEFPEPKKDESLKGYSARMAENISDENENILIGMSMGGFIAQEISLIKKVDKLILLSSYTEGQDWQLMLELVKKFNLTELMVDRAFKDIVLGALKLIPGYTKSEKEFFLKMAKDFSANYYTFAAKRLVNWQPVKLNCPVIKIHGTKDELFPISKVNANYTVEGGGHLMVVNFYKEINEYLKQAIA